MRHSQSVWRAWLPSQTDEGSNSDSVLLECVTLDQLLNLSALIWKVEISIVPIPEGYEDCNEVSSVSAYQGI